MTNGVKIFLAILISAITVAVFMYPQLMVSPGHLIPAHKSIEHDCFACHTPLLGATEARCTTCHKLADIGKLTTEGLPFSKTLNKTPFHQQLTDTNCLACHSDHTGVMRLKPAGHFQHELLPAATRNQCQSCHKAPTDELHQQTTGNCGECHSQKKWQPATFNHDQYFLLEGDHNAKCVTCHVKNNFKTYSCYGCHEHTPGNIREEHLEEGIDNFENCVECHRSGDERDIRNRRKDNRNKERDND